MPAQYIPHQRHIGVDQQHNQVADLPSLVEWAQAGQLLIGHYYQVANLLALQPGRGQHALQSPKQVGAARRQLVGLELGGGRIGGYHLLVLVSAFVGGILLQGAVLPAMLFTEAYPAFLALAALLGAGTTLVYPTFQAAVAEYAPLAQRARNAGILRFWRDAGYALGALLTGLLADAFGLLAALAAIGGLTVLLEVVVRRRMYCVPKPVSADDPGRTCSRPAPTTSGLQTARLAGHYLAAGCGALPLTLRCSVNRFHMKPARLLH